MRKSQVLAAVALVGIVFSGCQLPKLPELPKNREKKQKMTDEECKKIIKKYDELREQGWIGNEGSLDRNYSLDAQICRMQLDKVEIDIEKIMEINK